MHTHCQPPARYGNSALMKHVRMIPLAALALVAVLLLAVAGCTPASEERLSALEAEVAALKERNAASREELAQVRKNLEAIHDLLKLDQGRARLKESTEPEADKDLDTKAKDFVDKNLDRLLELTKKLLDKMEKELDEQFDKMNEPAPPQGDQI